MRGLILILAIVALANGRIDPDFRKRHYIPKFAKISPINSAKEEPQNVHHGKFRSNISPFIIGGQEAVPHSRPYQAALYIDDTYFCEGTLITSEWVYTAAHCTFGSQSIVVVLGAHNRSVAEPSQVSLESTGSLIITHADYDPITLANDVALIRLPTAVTLTAEIQPVTLPSVIDSDLDADVQVTISGWGLTVDDPAGETNDVLKVATLATISNTECTFYYGSVMITEATLCTSTTRGVATCYGDSGAPLTYDSGSGPVHRGLVSFFPPEGCSSGLPDGFIRTTHYLDWIQQQIGTI